MRETPKSERVLFNNVRTKTLISYRNNDGKSFDACVFRKTRKKPHQKDYKMLLLKLFAAGILYPQLHKLSIYAKLSMNEGGIPTVSALSANLVDPFIGFVFFEN